MTIPAAPAAAVTALYEACEDAAERVALDHAWAEFRGFTLPGPRDDDDLAVKAIAERGKP